jgi:hypothetical protein
MEVLRALNRDIVKRSPNRRVQPNAGPVTANPDGAARRRSLAVASLLFFRMWQMLKRERFRSDSFVTSYRHKILPRFGFSGTFWRGWVGMNFSAAGLSRCIHWV